MATVNNEDFQKIAKEKLLLDMSNLSEDMYCAGWLIGLEYYLWQKWEEIKDLPIDDTREKTNYLSDWPNNRVREIVKLAQICNGWWVWNDEDEHKKFVPMEEWLKQYEHWKNE